MHSYKCHFPVDTFIIACSKSEVSEESLANTQNQLLFFLKSFIALSPYLLLNILSNTHILPLVIYLYE